MVWTRLVNNAQSLLILCRMSRMLDLVAKKDALLTWVPIFYFENFFKLVTVIINCKTFQSVAKFLKGNTPTSINK